jgi:hypothetical protein
MPIDIATVVAGLLHHQHEMEVALQAGVRRDPEIDRGAPRAAGDLPDVIRGGSPGPRSLGSLLGHALYPSDRPSQTG